MRHVISTVSARAATGERANAGADAPEREREPPRVSFVAFVAGGTNTTAAGTRRRRSLDDERRQHTRARNRGGTNEHNIVERTHHTGGAASVEREAHKHARSNRTRARDKAALNEEALETPPHHRIKHRRRVCVYMMTIVVACACACVCACAGVCAFVRQGTKRLGPLCAAERRIQTSSGSKNDSYSRRRHAISASTWPSYAVGWAPVVAAAPSASTDAGEAARAALRTAV